MNKKIKVCSLFSGLGGFETGVFKAFGKENVEVVFASEIDKYASFSYEVVYGHKPHGDITKIDEKDIPEHDLLVAGFPCQSFSMAGKRLGLQDTRGTLFFEVARIIKEKQPKTVLLENVKGLLMHDKGKTFEVIVKVLSSFGYSVDFTILNSKFFDVPQSRDRIYIVAVKGEKVVPWDLENTKGIIAKTKKKLLNDEEVNSFNFLFPSSEKTTTRLVDILENEVDDKYFLTLEKEKKVLERNKSVKSEFLKFKKENELQLIFFDGITDEPNWLNNGKRYSRNYKQGSRIYSANGLASTLAASATNSFYLTPDWRIRKLTPLECFRIQGFPDTYYKKLKENGVSERQMCKMAGNAVTTNVIKNIVDSLKVYL